MKEILLSQNKITLVDDIAKPAQCSCGAKYTSYPKHHLGWCDLNE